jgi:ABC-type multidrug transport system ATPase subunit
MRLAAALVHDPQVLVLDEPLNGTDPRQRLDFHDTMTELAEQGRTILILLPHPGGSGDSGLDHPADGQRQTGRGR